MFGRFAALVILSITAGCVSDPNLYVDYLKGSGSVNRGADGTTSFRYVVATSGYEDLLNTEQEMNDQMDFLVGNYLGEQNACSNGYRITSRYQQDGFHIVEGVCR
jgi:hypothetical protein